jgi:hypothetical protein
MNLQKIQAAFQKYKNYVRRQAIQKSKNRLPDKVLFKWESLKTFQDNWDIDAPDFGEMYDRSLQNSETKRLWKRENYEPKRVMLKFIDMQPDFVRYMFKDLFDESKEIVGRVDRFVFHCDELLREYKELHPRSIENNHYHDDGYQIVSTYLAFRYPEQYSIYNFDRFQKLLDLMGVKDIPQSSDFARFCKVMKTLYKLMSREEDILKFHLERLSPEKHFMGNSLLIVEDFYRMMT